MTHETRKGKMMKLEYQTDDLQDTVIIEESIFTTFTGGTYDPLYRGEDESAARQSLEMTEEQWADLLAGEPIEVDEIGRAT